MFVNFVSYEIETFTKTISFPEVLNFISLLDFLNFFSNWHFLSEKWISFCSTPAEINSRRIRKGFAIALWLYGDFPKTA